MNDTVTALVTGLDRRMSYAAEALTAKAKVFGYGLSFTPENVTAVGSPDELSGSVDLILLPMMNSCGSRIPTELGKVSLREIALAAKPEALAAGGLIPDAAAEELASLGLRTADYFRSEELQIKNALLTAEGALSVIASQSDEVICGMSILVTGWGRVAKACAKLFAAVGARVTVAARKPSALAEAGCLGLETVPLTELADRAEKYRVIVNTVPAPVISAEVIRRTQRNCLIVDLASRPGGTDATACAVCGRNFVHALALPGKYAPKTAGGIVAETVIDMFEKYRSAP